jgi:hypothetical protein
MMTQNMITTVVEPTVSDQDGNETLRTSLLTSAKNCVIADQSLVNIRPSHQLLCSPARARKTFFVGG